MTNNQDIIERPADIHAGANPTNSSSDSEKIREKTSFEDDASKTSKPQEGVVGDAPGGGDDNLFGGGKTYRTMGLWDTMLVLATNQVGLGILTLPAILKTLGLVPGLIAIVGLGVVSWYTAYELLQFYRAHPQVVNMVDMARIVGGRPLELIFGVGLLFKVMMTCGSATVTLSIAFNTLSNHSTCTVAFAAVGAVCCWVLCLPRTFKFVAQAGLPCTVSIIVAVFIVIISLGVAGHPRGEVHGFAKEVVIIGNPSFREGVSACLKVCYAYAGNVGFVSYMAEMKNPSRDFPKALTILQVFSVLLYILTAVTIYALSGQAVRSPALGSAPDIPAKVAYAIALPAILSTGMVFGHTAIKYIYVVALRATKTTHRATENSVRSWGLWVGSATVFWVLAFILASAIPIFDSILSISSATFVAWFTFGVSGVFWYHRNWQEKFARKNIPLAIVNALLIIQALFMNGVGMWASVQGLLEVYHTPGKLEGSFTCADNSIF
ncbi:amino acid transporter [Beauveria brongniartii RCEF 3172]|uniref:Amino acid transporter n=1 Tax=Beauveria brongniartii RCEF 3172 TaxID=1081107 RepID=A0A162I0Z2_9HYPO|nr:amino acid transporter [Beauveria brongniartii RCEF 3172]